MKQRAGSKPGWYPDPLRRHQLRYWDGTRWTSDAADDGRRFTDPVSAASSSAAGFVVRSEDGFWTRHRTLAKVLWNTYAIPFTLLMVLTWAVDFHVYPHQVVSLVLYVPALIALHLYVWDRKVLRAAFWKVFAFGFIAWIWVSILVITPAVSGVLFDPWYLIAIPVYLPFYVALFRYAYRGWPTAK